MLCCLLFIAGVCAMVYLGVYGFDKGNPNLIFRGVDQNGHVCGDANNAITANFPYIYWQQPDTDLQKRACVDSCPVWDGTVVNQVTCAVAADCNTNAWQVTIDSSGNTATGTYTSGSGQVLGYDSY